jgi:uncharacterized protein YlxW (UPF0749 family)
VVVINIRYIHICQLILSILSLWRDYKMKPLPAIFAAFGITAVVVIVMFGIGANALLNPNIVPVVNAASPANTADVVQVVDTTTSGATTDQQVSQLQALIAQYQDREKQYQSRLNDAATQLNQANQQLQSYQQVMGQLQQLGMIRVGADGSITIRRRGGD